EAVRVRARHVEGLDAADRAEEVLGGAGVEAIAGERLAAREQAEARARHDQVQEARPRADRAVALADLERGRRVDLEADAAAMTAAVVGDHLPAPRTAEGRAAAHYATTAGASANAGQALAIAAASGTLAARGARRTRDEQRGARHGGRAAGTDGAGGAR